MKISKSRIKQLISESIQKILNEEGDNKNVDPGSNGPYIEGEISERDLDLSRGVFGCWILSSTDNYYNAKLLENLPKTTEFDRGIIKIHLTNPLYVPFGIEILSIKVVKKFIDEVSEYKPGPTHKDLLDEGDINSVLRIIENFIFEYFNNGFFDVEEYKKQSGKLGKIKYIINKINKDSKSGGTFLKDLESEIQVWYPKSF